MQLDIYTLIFIAITVVVVLQLRSVLGKRTGNERPPFDPYSSKEESKVEKTDTADNVVTMPRRPGAPEPVINHQLDEGDTVTAVIDKLAQSGTALNAGLKAIAEVDHYFNPDEFVKGANGAYELIVTAFAAGDRKTLRNLLSSDVFDGFDAAIDEREKRKETIDFSFVGINRSVISAAELVGSAARVRVDFRSEIISATMDEEGRVIEGDPNAVDEVTDIWTFERDTNTGDPNWKLIATETPE
ncbi:MAG: Tim44/TimA family putative adaptor protein [Pseudomonadota bacterium]